jgi:hypothetical protein
LVPFSFFVLLKVEKGDIGWAEKYFKVGDLTHRVKTVWMINGQRYALESVVKEWITYGDFSVEEFDNKWLSDEPDDLNFEKIMEFVGKKIAKSFRKEPKIKEIKEALKKKKRGAASSTAAIRVNWGPPPG